MEGSETLASPSAEVWISFLSPHHSVLTSSVSHFRNDYQVGGQNFSSPFLPSGDADSSICEKCLSVFKFRLSYLTSVPGCFSSSQFWHWNSVKDVQVAVFSYFRESCWSEWKMSFIKVWEVGRAGRSVYLSNHNFLLCAIASKENL